MAASPPGHPSDPQLPPAPELKNLTETQRKAFDALKKLCEEHDNLWPPSEAESARGIQHNHDVTLMYVLPCNASYKSLPYFASRYG
jgi:hypothetical protein